MLAVPSAGMRGAWAAACEFASGSVTTGNEAPNNRRVMSPSCRPTC